MNPEKISYNKNFNFLIKSFLKGVIIVVPIGATLYVVFMVFSMLDNIIPYDLILPESWNRHGIGFITLILFITAVGYFFDKFVFGKVLFQSLDQVLERTPGLKHIYTPTKDVMASFMGDTKKFDKPVWVRVNETPEVWRIGFLTQKEMGEVDKEHYVAVYLPHSYAISGWVIVTKKDNIKPVIGMTPASAMKFAVSGGVAGFHNEETIFSQQLPEENTSEDLDIN